VDYWDIVKESFRTVRTQRGLWGFAGISAVAGVFGSVVFGLLGVVVALDVMLGQLLVMGDASGGPAAVRVAGALLRAQAQARPWMPMIVAAVALLVVAWLVAVIFDVAAAGGVIAQTDKSLRGERVSFRAGMSQGFALWGRTATLMALAAAPALATAFMQTAGMFVTVTLPLMSGAEVDVAGVLATNRMTNVVGSLLSLLAIPLGVLCALALRWALLEGATWRSALGAAWRACTSNLAEVALIYLVLLALSVVAGVLIGVVVGVLAAVLAIIVVMLFVAGSDTAALAVGALSAGCLILIGAAIQGGLSVVVSVAYTLFWRRLTAPADDSSISAPGLAVEGNVS